MPGSVLVVRGNLGKDGMVGRYDIISCVECIKGTLGCMQSMKLC